MFAVAITNLALVPNPVAFERQHKIKITHRIDVEDLIFIVDDGAKL
jgi:hypothetical protein